MELIRIVLTEHENVVIRFGGFNQDHILDRSVFAFSLEVEDVDIMLWLILGLFGDKFDDISAVIISHTRIKLP